MSERTPVWIGIDGGSTYSFGVAVEWIGRSLGSLCAAPSTFGSADFFRCQNLQDLIKSLEGATACLSVFERIVIGSQSVMIEGAPEFKEQLCRGIVPMAETRLSGAFVYHFPRSQSWAAGAYCIQWNGLQCFSSE